MFSISKKSLFMPFPFLFFFLNHVTLLFFPLVVVLPSPFLLFAPVCMSGVLSSLFMSKDVLPRLVVV